MRVEESFGDVVSDDFYRVFSGKERYCKGVEFCLQYDAICNEEVVSKNLKENNTFFAFK